MTLHSPDSLGRSQRANDRALGYWLGLRGERAFPEPAEVMAWAEPAAARQPLAPNVFLLDVAGGASQSVFVRGGAALDSICGAGVAGQRIADCLPAALGRSVLGFVRAAAKTGRPITVSSSFDDGDGGAVLYRSAFLPLSADQRHVGHLLGSFSYTERLAA